ncbi:hypothetical protein DNTS_009008 [Danionella cerebrum]|uniref:stearoyl-CoA 9-desaturase n=1 Tax=Danionella cerebrum TaxID=2873325 RepID=A0A553QAC3_9TELE|nr:hypothetical protein DNTS_009008 [Danionella translucida]
MPAEDAIAPAPKWTAEDEFDESYEEKEGPKPPIIMVWRNVLLMGLLHMGAVYGLFLIPSAKPFTLIWSKYHLLPSITPASRGRPGGIRRTSSAPPCLNSISCMLRVRCSGHHGRSSQVNDIYEWSRDHRVHHKYSETDADPHNATRGFFFSHVGWLLVRKHPDVIEKGRKLELTDLKADGVVMFQRRQVFSLRLFLWFIQFYKPSVVIMCFVVPSLVPWLLWGESLWVAYFLPAVLRYTVGLNATWLVNSAAHMWGNRPYDSNINPRENRFVAFSAIGEGFHNYHHTFPFDYSTSEYGCKLNLTTCFIDLMCFLRLARDPKRVSSEAINARVQRTGDGSHRSG